MFHYTSLGSLQRMNSATTAHLERAASASPPASPGEEESVSSREEVLLIPVPVTSAMSQEHLHNHNRLHSKDNNMVLVPVAVPRASKMEQRIKNAKLKQEKSKNDKLMTYQQRVIKNTSIWKEQVLPNFAQFSSLSSSANHKIFLSLLFDGLPPSLRGYIWQKLIGNSLQVTADVFASCCLSAETFHRQFSAGASPEAECMHSTIPLITHDIPRTFPQLSFFHDGGPMQMSLERILRAFTSYSKIGYIQGMSFIVAVLLLYMDEFPAFVCLCNLFNHRCTRVFYALDHRCISKYIAIFDTFFHQFLPLLYVHFKQEGVASDMFLVDWYLTIFSKALPLDAAVRIWDNYLFHGEVFLLRAALGLLRYYATELSGYGVEMILNSLVKFPADINIDALFANIKQIRISSDKYERIYSKHDPTAPDGQRISSKQNQAQDSPRNNDGSNSINSNSRRRKDRSDCNIM